MSVVVVKATAEINKAMKELAQYSAMESEIQGIIKGLKTTLQQYITDNKAQALEGEEHKALYTEYTTTSLDTARIKKELPGIVASYSKTTQKHKFTFE